MTEAAGRPAGLLASLSRLASTAIEIVQTRIELIAAELDEERARLAQALLLAVVAAFFLALGVLLAVLFLVVLFWDTHRLLALGSLALLSLLAGGSALMVVRARLAQRPRLFSRTLEELARDRDDLGRVDRN